MILFQKMTWTLTTFLMFSTSPLWANCPNLDGVFICPESSIEILFPGTLLSISQATDDKSVTTYHFGIILKPYFTKVLGSTASSDGASYTGRGMSSTGSCKKDHLKVVYSSLGHFYSYSTYALSDEGHLLLREYDEEGVVEESITCERI